MANARVGYCFFLFTLICVSTGFVFAGWCPPTDLNGNCWVNLDDVQIFAQQWLDTEACEEEEICADFDGLNGVDFADFSTLASYWQAHGSLLFINEFMASNNSDSNIHDPFGDYDDWIEIYNFSDSPRDLAGMYLTDDLTNLTKWQIPSGYPSQTTAPAKIGRAHV